MTEATGTDGAGSGAGAPGARRPLIVLAVVILIVALFRWNRLDLPLERDEGEYAYAGKLILQGHPPYEAAYNMKLPGIYVAYALVMAVCGLSTAGIHLGLLLVNAGSIVLMQRIGRRLLGEAGGLATAALFAVLSLHPAFEGLCANAEHFVLLPALGGLLVLLRARDGGTWRSYLVSGVLLGTGFVVKQHGAAFVAAAGVIVVADALRATTARWRTLVVRGGAYGVGAVLPFVAICAWMSAAGVFDRFWFWTFTYASEYAAIVPLEQGRRLLAIQLSAMGGGLFPVWALVAGGVAALAASPLLRAARFPLLVLLVASVAAVCPGFYFRNHYFLLLLPAASLAGGAAAAAVFARLEATSPGPRSGLVTGGIVAACAAAAVVAKWPVLVTQTDERASRTLFGGNPFPESVEISRWIRENTKPSDVIAVIGSEPQIYFHSGRPVATAHIYTYALMEPQPFALKMQEEMVAQIEAAKPAILVFVGVSTSWLPRENSSQDILRWAEAYIAANYEQVGLADIYLDRTVYAWGADSAGAAARSQNWVGVYRRRTP